MGGSGLAGEVLAAVCGPGCAVPVVTVHDYQLPGWVGAADLVIAVSCSGSAEETLAGGRGGAPGLPAGRAWARPDPAGPDRRAGARPVRADSSGRHAPGSTLWGLSVPLLVIADRLGLAEVAGG